QQLPEVLVEAGGVRVTVGDRVLAGDAFGAVEIEVQEAPRARRVARVALNLGEDAVTDFGDAIEPLTEFPDGDAARGRLDAPQALVRVLQLPAHGGRVDALDSRKIEAARAEVTAVEAQVPGEAGGG